MVTSAITFRQPNLSDIDAIYKIERDVFIDWYPYSLLHYLITMYQPTSLVIEINNEIIGYSISRIEQEGYAHILAIAIARSYQGRGLGKVLLYHTIELLFQYTDLIRLEVRTTNQRAINLYKKFGFEVVQTLRKYYSSGEDGYVMYLSNIKWNAIKSNIYSENIY